MGNNSVSQNPHLEPLRSWLIFQTVNSTSWDEEYQVLLRYEQMVVTLLPCSLCLLLFLPLLVKWKRVKFTWSCYQCMLRLVLVTMLFLISLCRLISNCIFTIQSQNIDLENILGLSLISVCMLSLILVTFCSNSQGSAFQTLTCTSFIILWIPKMCLEINSLIKDHSFTDFSSIDTGTVIAQFAFSILAVIAFSISHVHRRGNEKIHEIWPETWVSFTNRMLFFYFWRLLAKGYRKRLKLSDLWSLDYSESAEGAYSEFMRRYSDKKSLALILLQTHWQTLIGAGLLKLIYDLCTFVYIWIISLSINLTMDPDEPRWHGFAYMGFLLSTLFLRCFCLEHYCFHMSKVGVRIRSAFSAAIYRKVLRLSPNARRLFTSGEIQNLVSVDLERFCESYRFFHLIWSGPFRICISVYFLQKSVGNAAWPGVIVVVVLACTSILISKFFRKFLVKQMGDKDERVHVLAEVIRNMKLIKLFAWEPAFQSIIQRIRDLEIRNLKSGAFISGFSEIALTSIIPLSCLTIFGTYTTIFGNTLTAHHAFGVVAALNAIYVPLVWLSATITAAIGLTVSIRRLKAFLIAEELNDYTSVMPDDNAKPNAIISLTKACFNWDNSSNCNLRDISLDVKQGQLVAVIGTVGAGKSSLLNSLIGQMYLTSGTISIKGTVAYVPQQAWILNDTFRENVLFGKAYQKVEYEKIIRDCALEQDLKMFTNGDMTEIGERGTTLSGGQKQRLSLARAVYQNCDVYLLDDPLSAVDVHVRKQLFENVIGPNGLLRFKTRILVTHSLTFLPQCDSVVIMDDGRIVQIGTFAKLIQNNNHVHLTLPITETDSIVDDLDSYQTDLDEHEHIEIQIQKISSMPKIAYEPSKALTNEESDLQNSHLSWSAFKLYLRSCGWPLFGYCILSCSAFSCWTLAIIWLQKWTDSYLDKDTNTTFTSAETGLKVFGTFVTLQVVLAISFTLCFGVFSTRASKCIHNLLLESLLHAPMAFFDTTPTGRMLSRCGKDINVIDNQVPYGLAKSIQFMTLMTLMLVPSLYATPLLAFALLPAMIAFFFLMRFFVKSSKQFRRLEAITRSPVYTRLQETLQGLDSIRAYGKMDQFCQHQESLINANTQALLTLFTGHRWLSINLEFIGSFLIAMAGLLAVLKLSTDGLSPGMMGSLAIIFNLMDLICWSSCEISALDTEIVALDRVNEYLNVKSEGSWTTTDIDLSKDWPTHGQIEFKNFSTKYRPELPMALNNVNLRIDGGQKVGIVGRTGSGKSTLTLALFRMLEAAEGSILIDSTDISKIGLHDLRRQLTIIPQEPCLFSGTVRRNLDPFDEYTDDALWSALQFSHLNEYVSNLSKGLQTVVEEGGVNMSSGQRQLMCMARAILRKTKILILDEATASVDLDIDAWIQDTLGSQFSDCTVITIAHRLSTILDYDMILVLDNGHVLEYGTIRNLLSNVNSIFHKMALEAGVIPVGQ